MNGISVFIYLFIFFRITRELNPGIENFRNLGQQQFLLGAIGPLNGKTVAKKFAIRVQLFESWITLSTDYHTIQRISIRKTNYLSQPIKIRWISLYKRTPPKQLSAYKYP